MNLRCLQLGFAVGLVMAYPLMVTAVHELGHALAATLLGYKVKSISLGLDGDPAFVNIAGPFNGHDYDIIQLSGGLMVALFFAASAFFVKRSLVLMAPFHVVYGVYEMVGPIPSEIGTLMAISWVVFIAIVVSWFIRRVF